MKSKLRPRGKYVKLFIKKFLNIIKGIKLKLKRRIEIEEQLINGELIEEERELF